MLKIITDLTDAEIASMKHKRRLMWHFPTRTRYRPVEPILDQELQERGIDLPLEPYIEYEKRPPHDKYL